MNNGQKNCPSFAGFGRESKSNSFCQVQFSVKTNKRNKSKHKGHSLAFKCPLFMWRIDKSWQSKKWFKLKYIIAIVKPPDFQRKAVLLWHGRDWLPNQWGASNLQLVFLFPRGILWAGELFDNSTRWPLRRRYMSIAYNMEFFSVHLLLNHKFYLPLQTLFQYGGPGKKWTDNLRWNLSVPAAV